MSYQLYDSYGYIADVATNSGMAALRRWVEDNRNDLPNLNGFLRLGVALMTQEFVDEVERLELPSDQDLARTLANLKEQIRKCDSVAIINNSLE